MFITAFFTNIGVPATGLSPTIRIRRVDTGALVVTDDSMTELGDGFYKYDFTIFDATLDYVFRSDGTATLNDGDRFVIGSNEVPIDDVNNDSVRLDADGLIASAVDKIVDQVWNELTSGHQAAGSTGLALTDGYALTVEQVNAIADGVWDESTADHQAPGTTGLALSASGASPDAIADAVWDEATVDHQTAGSTGLALTDGYALTPGQVSAITNAVWDEDTTDHQAPGTTGLKLDNTAEPSDVSIRVYESEPSEPK